MNSKLQKMILAEHSRAQMELIVAWIGCDDARLKTLVDLFLSNDKKISQRAGYPLSKIGELYPDMLVPYLAPLLTYARTPGKHDAVYRSIARILEYVPAPHNLEGDIMNLCFDWVMDPQQKVAVKAFSLSVLAKMMDTYPEISSELIVLIEDQYQHQTAAFKSRAKKILKAVDKIRH